MEFRSARRELEDSLKPPPISLPKREHPETASLGENLFQPLNDLRSCMTLPSEEPTQVPEPLVGLPATHPSLALRWPRPAISVPRSTDVRRPDLQRSSEGFIRGSYRLPLTQEPLESGPVVPDEMTRRCIALNTLEGHWTQLMSRGDFKAVRRAKEATLPDVAHFGPVIAEEELQLAHVQEAQPPPAKFRDSAKEQGRIVLEPLGSEEDDARPSEIARFAEDSVLRAERLTTEDSTDETVLLIDELQESFVMGPNVLHRGASQTFQPHSQTESQTESRTEIMSEDFQVTPAARKFVADLRPELASCATLDPEHWGMDVLRDMGMTREEFPMVTAEVATVLPVDVEQTVMLSKGLRRLPEKPKPAMPPPIATDERRRRGTSALLGVPTKMIETEIREEETTSLQALRRMFSPDENRPPPLDRLLACHRVFNLGRSRKALYYEGIDEDKQNILHLKIDSGLKPASGSTPRAREHEVNVHRGQVWNGLTASADAFNDMETVAITRRHLGQGAFSLDSLGRYLTKRKGQGRPVAAALAFKMRGLSERLPDSYVASERPGRLEDSWEAVPLEEQVWDPYAQPKCSLEELAMRLRLEVEERQLAKVREQESWERMRRQNERRSAILDRDKAKLRSQMAKHEQLLEKKRLRERTLIRQVRSSDASTLLRRLRDLHMLDPQIHVDDTDMLDEEAPLPPVTFGEVQEFLKDEVDVELASNVKAAERSVVSFAHPHEARPNWVRTSFNLVAVFSSITVISGWTRSNDGIVYWAELKAAGLLLWQAPPHRKEDGAPIPPNTSTVSRNLVLALYFLPHHPPVVCRPPPQWAQRLQFDPIYTIVGLDLNTGGPHPFNMETSSVQKWIRKDHKSRRRSGKRIELDLGYLFPLSGLHGHKKSLDLISVVLYPEVATEAWSAIMARVWFNLQYIDRCDPSNRVHPGLMYSMWQTKAHTLHLDRYQVTTRDLEALRRAAKLEDAHGMQHHTWENLSITQAGFTPDRAPLYCSLLDETLNAFDNVSTLDLSYNRLTMECLNAGLTNLLLRNPLKAISMHHCELEDGIECSKLLRGALGLEIIDLSFNFLGYKFVRGLRGPIEGAHLRVVQLNNNNFGDAELTALKDYLYNANSTVEVLDLSNNPGCPKHTIDDSGLRMGAKVAEDSVALRHFCEMPFPSLFIRQCRVARERLESFLERMPTHMTTLDLERCSGSLQFPIPEKRLDLFRVSLVRTGIMAYSLLDLPPLVAFCEATRPFVLDLSENDISDVPPAWLGDVFFDLTTTGRLLELRLNSAVLTAPFFDSIQARCLRESRFGTLRVLYVTGHLIDMDFLASLGVLVAPFLPGLVSIFADGLSDDQRGKVFPVVHPRRPVLRILDRGNAAYDAVIDSVRALYGVEAAVPRATVLAEWSRVEPILHEQKEQVHRYEVRIAAEDARKTLEGALQTLRGAQETPRYGFDVRDPTSYARLLPGSPESLLAHSLHYLRHRTLGLHHMTFTRNPLDEVLFFLQERHIQVLDLECCSATSNEFYAGWRALIEIYGRDPGLHLATLNMSRMHLTPDDIGDFQLLLQYINITADQLDLSFNNLSLTCESDCFFILKFIRTVSPRRLVLDCNNLGDHELSAQLFVSLLLEPHQRMGLGVEVLSMACCCLGSHFAGSVRSALDDAVYPGGGCDPAVWSGVSTVGVQQNILSLQQSLSLAGKLLEFEALKTFCIEGNPIQTNVAGELRQAIGGMAPEEQRRVQSIIDWDSECV